MMKRRNSIQIWKVLESEIDKKRNQLTVATPFEQTGEYARLAAKIERLRAGSGKTNELAANRIGTLQTELAAIDAQISAYMSAKERSATAAAQDESALILRGGGGAAFLCGHISADLSVNSS